jgi:hypothetical protein
MAARKMQEAKSAKEGFERTEMAARKMQMAKSATERILGTQWLTALQKCYCYWGHR